MYEKYDKETMEWRVDSMLSAAQRGKDLTEKLSLIYAMYQECSDKVYEEWKPQSGKDVNIQQLNLSNMLGSSYKRELKKEMKKLFKALKSSQL